ncbi:hypothetical protein ACHAXS_006164 [Conticribra weissflogii]
MIDIRHAFLILSVSKLTAASLTVDGISAFIPQSFSSIGSRALAFTPKDGSHRPPWRRTTHPKSHKIKLSAIKANQDETDNPSKKSEIDFKKKNEETKISQQKLLQTLESKLDYDGRISSKIDVSSSGIDEDDGIEHRCALITIVGLPNMGKSTLLNALLSDTLAITTSRPQTTRHAILGVLTTDYCQLCLTDTPGIIDNPAYKMQEGMMDVVKGAIRDGDVFLVVTDVYSGSGSGDTDENEGEFGKSGNDASMEDEFLGIGEEVVRKLQQSNKPIIVCVNKVDLVMNEDSSGMRNTPLKAVQSMQKWRNLLPNAFAILPTCAANGPNDPGVEALRSILLANDPSVDVGGAIRNLGRPVPGMFSASLQASSASGAPAMITNDIAREILPVGPPLYHPDFFTDRTDRFCTSELIRETLFTSLGKELPYCCEVRVESFDESKRYLDEAEGNAGKNGKSLIKIGATIFVERDSQKGIVVGKGGKKIKEVGINARKKLEEFFGVKIFLDLNVKVDKDWRNNTEKLKKFGYM